MNDSTLYAPFEAFVTGRNLLLAGGVGVVVAVVRSAAPEFFASKNGQRLLPLLPVVLGILGAFLGFGEPTSSRTWQDRITLGLVCGLTASWVYQTAKRVLMGKVRMKREPADASRAPAGSDTRTEN